MTTMELVALSAFSICIVFTAIAAKDTSKESGQSVRDSMIEAWQNIFWGFGLNWMANLLLLPLMLRDVVVITPYDAFLLGWPYTVISLLRTFWIRRKNNNKHFNKEIKDEVKS